MDQLLTVAQVAQRLQISEKSVYRLAQRGELPGLKVGGSWRFRADDIELWIDRQVERGGRGSGRY